MKAPQIILCVFFGASLLANAYLHGKPREGRHSLPEALFSTAMVFGLLIWGGFFE